MEWHLSKYNIFSKLKNTNFIIGFNLFRGTIVILSPKEILSYYNFKELKKDDDLFLKLKKAGFIINYDEIALIKAINKQQNYMNKSVGITICPTIGCNFDCTYCFEKHGTGKMTEETQNDLVSFIEKMLNNINGNGIYVTWFGGEPLIAIDVIDSLSQRLIKIAEDRKIKYQASIITNGYLLNQKNVNILSKNKVNRYQITLDGIGEMHDKTRHLANGDPTFEVIVENLRTVRIPGAISIRHNIYEDNKNDGELLKRLIESLKRQSNNNITYYPAIVAKNPANYLDDQVNYLNDEESFIIGITRDCKTFPRYKRIFCGAQKLNGITVDDKGRLYKCWEDVDKPERSFGSIKEWNIKNPYFTASNLDILTSYINSIDLSDDEECMNCVLLPVCAGGCPSKRKYSNKVCALYKNNINDYAAKLADNYYEKFIKNGE